jgi:glyoxylase-like metal-dependent hydrolase (beta-lactamase superfamily II)
MQLETFFDERTFTLTYVVFDEATRDALVIDPVLDFEPAGGKLWTESLERVAAFVDAKKLTVHFVLETHAHADHLSGAQWLKKRYGAKVGISARVTEVQGVFKDVFGLDQLPTDGRQFDVLLKTSRWCRQARSPSQSSRRRATRPRA